MSERHLYEWFVITEEFTKKPHYCSECGSWFSPDTVGKVALVDCITSEGEYLCHDCTLNYLSICGLETFLRNLGVMDIDPDGKKAR